jgi:hypothetical protein
VSRKKRLILNLFETNCVSHITHGLWRLPDSRHWRTAGTHTLHDPAAWKIQHLGRWAVDGTPPPNHGQV